ncbi:MAG: hypothetical protein ACREMQ_18430 [Longimicrobiales bacterium]
MKSSMKSLLITLVVGLLAFGIGAGWQYVRANRLQSELNTAQRALTLQRLENMLAVAVLEAQHGRHEEARQLASAFFSGLQQDIAQVPDSARQTFNEILQRRDAAITALSRSDPEAGSILAQLFARYRTGLGEPMASTTAAPPATPPAPPDTAR